MVLTSKNENSDSAACLARSGSPAPTCSPAVPLTHRFSLTCEGEGGSTLEQEPLLLASEQWREPGREERPEEGTRGATSTFWNHLHLPAHISSQRQRLSSGQLCSPSALPKAPLHQETEREIDA